MNQEWAQNGNTQTQAERQHYTTEQRWAKEEINRELRKVNKGICSRINKQDKAFDILDSKGKYHYFVITLNGVNYKILNHYVAHEN